MLAGYHTADLKFSNNKALSNTSVCIAQPMPRQCLIATRKAQNLKSAWGCSYGMPHVTDASS